MLSVVIPTRDRPELLQDLLACILNQSILPSEVIVVDSSSKIQKLNNEIVQKLNIKYFHVEIQSAAAQRNIGILNINPDSQFIAFLDDDVVVNQDYFEVLTSFLDDKKYIGVSGVVKQAQRPPEKKLRFKVGKFYKRIFLLDSKNEGKLLSSGVNVKIVGNFEYPREVEWLMGCSIWKKEVIDNITFENKLKNQSLGEDVIFSYRARRYGKLGVVPTVLLDHSVSQVGRATEVEFWRMWVQNRYLLISIMHRDRVKLAPYIWANLGQATMEFGKGLLLQSNGFKASATVTKETVRLLTAHYLQK